MALKKLLSLSQITTELEGVPYYTVNYYIRSRKIEPVALAGATPVYDPSVLTELRRVFADRIKARGQSHSSRPIA